MLCIEKNIQLELVLTNFVHRFSFISVAKSGRVGEFFCLESGN